MNRGGTESRFTFICFLEMNCSYKQSRDGGGFKLFFLFTFPSLNADLNTKKKNPNSKHQKKELYLDRSTMALESHWECFISQHITLEDIPRGVEAPQGKKEWIIEINGAFQGDTFIMPEMGRRCKKYFH